MAPGSLLLSVSPPRHVLPRWGIHGVERVRHVLEERHARDELEPVELRAHQLLETCPAGAGVDQVCPGSPAPLGRGVRGPRRPPPPRAPGAGTLPPPPAP